MTHPTKVDHYCTTADGTLCRVTYLSGTAFADAELMVIDTGERLTLPIAELRRVPDPRNQRPPIEDMPAERPRCAWCDRRLRPVVDDTRATTPGGASRHVVRRVFRRWSAYEEVFCTTRCAIRFAGASYRGGFRRKRAAA